MVLSKQKRLQKLRTLAEIEGFESIESMLEATVYDAVSPAICTNEDCDYSVEMEPDQDRGWCDECQTNSLAAAPVLAGII